VGDASVERSVHPEGGWRLIEKVLRLRHRQRGHNHQVLNLDDPPGVKAIAADGGPSMKRLFPPADVGAPTSSTPPSHLTIELSDETTSSSAARGMQE